VVMQLTSISNTGPAYWATQQVMTSIDWKAWDFGNFQYLHLANTVKYHIQDIFTYIIKVQWTDQEESKWTG
jgi:hypothetical protein